MSDTSGMMGFWFVDRVLPGLVDECRRCQFSRTCFEASRPRRLPHDRAFTRIDGHVEMVPFIDHARVHQPSPA